MSTGLRQLACCAMLAVHAIPRPANRRRDFAIAKIQAFFKSDSRTSMGRRHGGNALPRARGTAVHPCQHAWRTAALQTCGSQRVDWVVGRLFVVLLHAVALLLSGTKLRHPHPRINGDVGHLRWPRSSTPSLYAIVGTATTLKRQMMRSSPSCDCLVVPAIRKEPFTSMRKRKVTDIVTQRCHS